MLKVIGWLFLSIGLSGLAFGGDSLSQVDASEQTITVYYSTDWDDSYLHYRGDQEGWSELPGREMVSPFLGFKQTVVAASTVEFAFNNGAGEWVKHNNGNNFTISHPGTYVVVDDQ
ncbi:carbohydrate binding domain-containing protein, partial [Reinekea sp.]|uniref:carbohydrate binding domain-containing protein n=1 Tax=Reinekea sp. TaxID=1970455 RepID=UPI002A8103FC